MRCSSASHLPRSTSLQRREQKGNQGAEAGADRTTGRPQCGQLTSSSPQATSAPANGTESSARAGDAGGSPARTSQSSDSFASAPEDSFFVSAESEREAPRL